MDYSFQARLRPEHFPMVAKIEYTDRTYISEGEKTNALKFPRFIQVRSPEEKTVSECVNPLLDIEE
jgi:hypothetical protein